MLFFGPESARPGLQQDEQGAAGESETGSEWQSCSSSTRKHARESGPNGATDQAAQPAPKRSRKTAANDRARSVDNQQPQPSADLMLDQKISVEVVDHQDGRANAAISDSAQPVPHTKSPSASDLDQDTDMDVGLNNGAAHDLQADHGAFNGADSNGEPADQGRAMELQPPIPTLETGHSVGVQSAPPKTTELDLGIPESMILHVADDDHVISASWRPADPSVLAASGHNFLGVWKIPNQASRPGAVLPPFQTVIDKRDDAMVSAMAWEPRGTMLAIAVFDDHTAGAIRIYDGQDAVLIESLPAAQRLITMLRWQKVESRLMGFAASTDESSLVLWDLSGSTPLPGTFSITVSEQINDISWASHGNTSVVCAAGDGVVYQCRAVPDLMIEHKWSSEAGDHANWSFVRCSWWTEEVAIVIAASANPPALWIPSKNVYARDIHKALLTCLDVRPRQMVHPDQDPCFDFATSSLDGTVKIWRYNDHSASIDCLFKLSMADFMPVMVLAYTPDGHALAAASYDRVVLWNAEKRGPPLAKWEGHEPNWGGSYLRRQRRISHGETMSEDGVREDIEHSLTWDAESEKLGFALGNQVRATSSTPSCHNSSLRI